MKRDFKTWLGTFRESIADYAYYIDFRKVYRNVDEIKIELNILNALIGSDRIEEDFEKIVTSYPETLKCIPILLAVRSSEITAGLDGDFEIYNFTSFSGDIEEYKTFMRNTGLFDLLQHHLVHNLVDYVTGVETGLDSNGRKNRGGHLMENLVESFIMEAGFVKDKTYFKEMNAPDVERDFGVDLSMMSNNGKAPKRFDFVVKTENCVYLLETNFYNAGGSKLNETSGSYELITDELKDNKDVSFIWITDGAGWFVAKNRLEKVFDVLDNLYNINDLKNGILKTVLK